MAVLQQELVESLVRGMDDSASPNQVPQNAVRLLLNGRVLPDETAETRPGTRRIHLESLGDATGFGATHFRTAWGEDQIIAFSGTRGYVLRSENFEDQKLIADDMLEGYWDFASIRVGADMFLFMANGGVLYYWDGNLLRPSHEAPYGFKFLEIFNERLVGAGHQGVLVQASRIGDPFFWSSPFGFTVQVRNHDNANEISGMHQIGRHLVVFDTEAMSYIDGYGEQSLIVASGPTGVSRSVGCIAHRSIVSVGDNAMCWLSKRGVEHYAPGSGINLLSRRVENFMRSVDIDWIRHNPGQPSAAYDDRTQHYFIALPTTGFNANRNDRVLALNLLQDPFVDRSSMTAAPSIDQPPAVEGDVTFGIDEDGFLSMDGNFEMGVDADGFLTLLTQGEAGMPVVVDDDGFLSTVLSDIVPATLFTAPTDQHPAEIHSLGYDGFIRAHDGERDDVDFNGEGGTEVTMTLVRPFLLGRPRQRKRVRVVHVSAITATGTTLSGNIRAAGNIHRGFTIDIPGTAFDQPQRRKAMVHAIGDQPEVELHATGPVRIALMGVSCELLREPV